jgi:hypothetical protein
LVYGGGRSIEALSHGGGRLQPWRMMAGRGRVARHLRGQQNGLRRGGGRQSTVHRAAARRNRSAVARCAGRFRSAARRTWPWRAAEKRREGRRRVGGGAAGLGGLILVVGDSIWSPAAVGGSWRSRGGNKNEASA